MSETINREDMMELTRRMTLSRSSVGRIAGCYVDRDGDFDGSFNTNFLRLSAQERSEKLKLAKAVLFSETNRRVKKYKFPEAARKPGSMWQLLMGMRQCGLKNDALMDTFYDVVMENCRLDSQYGIFMFHGSYDVPLKASDKENLWESEEVYTYMICAVCPLSGDYEPDSPVCGFLFPAFTDRSTDVGHAAVFGQETDEVTRRILEILGVL